MTNQHLTKTILEKLKPASSDYIVWDKGVPGFGIRVKPSGVKSYIVQYRSKATGTSRRKTIGQFGPLLSLHKAKERARILLGRALAGEDPVAAEGESWLGLSEQLRA